MRKKIFKKHLNYYDSTQKIKNISEIKKINNEIKKIDINSIKNLEVKK